MIFVNETCFRSSLAWAVAVRTVTVAGRALRISPASASCEIPGLAATEIASSLPSRSKSFCAVGIVNTAKVADPSDLTFPYCAIPTSLNGRTGPRLVTRTVCPILKCCSSAVARSITTWSEELGQWPEVRRSGLKRGSEKSTPNPNEGAPLVEITLPLELRILAAV